MPNLDGSPREADIPCNVMAMLKVRDGKLEWQQIMRSNDLFIGTPHNIVQFTCLQEVMAGWLSLEVGSFVLVTDSLHIYEHDLGKFQISETNQHPSNPDSLSLPRDLYDQVLADMGLAMDALRDEYLQPARFVELLSSTQLPMSWRNLLYVVAADAARRRGWNKEMTAAASRCTNPSLNSAWGAWLSRRVARDHSNADLRCRQDPADYLIHHSFNRRVITDMGDWIILSLLFSQYLVCVS
jgi:thymidylate synthase